MGIIFICSKIYHWIPFSRPPSQVTSSSTMTTVSMPIFFRLHHLRSHCNHRQFTISTNNNIMKFPPAAKASFLATLSLLSPSVAFSTSSRSLTTSTSTAATLKRRRQLFGIASRSSSTAASAWSNSNNTMKQNSALKALPLTLRGGSALLSTTTEEDVAATTEAEDAPQEIFRTDYKPLPYKVSNVSMNFDIRDGKTVVERCVLIILCVAL